MSESLDGNDEVRWSSPEDWWRGWLSTASNQRSFGLAMWGRHGRKGYRWWSQHTQTSVACLEGHNLLSVSLPCRIYHQRLLEPKSVNQLIKSCNLSAAHPGLYCQRTAHQTPALNALDENVDWFKIQTAGLGRPSRVISARLNLAAGCGSSGRETNQTWMKALSSAHATCSTQTDENGTPPPARKMVFTWALQSNSLLTLAISSGSSTSLHSHQHQAAPSTHWQSQTILRSCVSNCLNRSRRMRRSTPQRPKLIDSLPLLMDTWAHATRLPRPILPGASDNLGFLCCSWYCYCSCYWSSAAHAIAAAMMKMRWSQEHFSGNCAFHLFPTDKLRYLRCVPKWFLAASRLNSSSTPISSRNLDGRPGPNSPAKPSNSPQTLSSKWISFKT